MSSAKPVESLDLSAQIPSDLLPLEQAYAVGRRRLINRGECGGSVAGAYCFLPLALRAARGMTGGIDELVPIDAVTDHELKGLRAIWRIMNGEAASLLTEHKSLKEEILITEKGLRSLMCAPLRRLACGAFIDPPFRVMMAIEWSGGLVRSIGGVTSVEQSATIVAFKARKSGC